MRFSKFRREPVSFEARLMRRIAPLRYLGLQGMLDG